MSTRRLLLGAAVGITAVVGLAPSADADALCAWVDPNGVCVSLPDLPDLPNDVPRLPRIPRLPL